MTEKREMPTFCGNLRKHSIEIPREVRECSGIRIFGKRIKAIVFSTDVAVIRNVNADAVIAVYPFTPQPVITHSLMLAADLPVFCGIGGGITNGIRSVDLALDAEFQGAIGVVVNAPISNEDVRQVSQKIDIPLVVTVVSEKEDIAARIRAGADILNVSAASNTPQLVQKIRRDFPDVAIIATGGPSSETIRRTVEAGANAISWTPPSTGALFKGVMERYRQEL